MQREPQESTSTSRQQSSSNQAIKTPLLHESSVQSYMAKSTQSTVLLATALVIVQGKNNVNYRFRALIDCGSIGFARNSNINDNFWHYKFKSR